MVVGLLAVPFFLPIVFLDEQTFSGVYTTLLVQTIIPSGGIAFVNFAFADKLASFLNFVAPTAHKIYSFATGADPLVIIILKWD